MVHLTPEEREELLDSVRTPGPNEARERLEGHIKPPFDTSEGSQFDRLLDTFASEFEVAESELEEVHLASFIETAHGRQLDKFGEFLQTPRQTGETDDHYRGRLVTQLAALTGGGTIWAIKQVCATLLKIDPSDAVIEEDFGTEPARFILTLEGHVIENSPVSAEEVRGFLETARAAGVRVEARTLGGFTHRAQGDVSDPAKGYDSLDETGQPRGEGGGYAGLI